MKPCYNVCVITREWRGGSVVIFVLHSLVWECMHVGIILQKTQSPFPSPLALNSILCFIDSSLLKGHFSTVNSGLKSYNYCNVVEEYLVY